MKALLIDLIASAIMAVLLLTVLGLFFGAI